MTFETKTVNRYFQIFNKQDRFIEFLSFPLEKPQLYTESHDHFAYFGNTEIERIRKQGEKTIRHMDLWINEFSHNMLAPAATFRFHVDYVNFLISRIYSASVAKS